MKENTESRKNNRDKEIRIFNMPKNTMDILNNIKKNSGLTAGAILKPELIKIINSYPEELKRTPSKD